MLQNECLLLRYSRERALSPVKTKENQYLFEVAEDCFAPENVGMYQRLLLQSYPHWNALDYVYKLSIIVPLLNAPLLTTLNFPINEVASIELRKRLENVSAIRCIMAENLSGVPENSCAFLQDRLDSHGLIHSGDPPYSSA